MVDGVRSSAVQSAVGRTLVSEVDYLVGSSDRNKTVITRRIMVILRRIRPLTPSARFNGSGALRAAQPIASQQLGSQIHPQSTVTANLLFVGSIPTGASVG